MMNFFVLVLAFMTANVVMTVALYKLMTIEKFQDWILNYALKNNETLMKKLDEKEL